MKRFDLDAPESCSLNGCMAEMREDENGDYVEYAEHRKIVKRLRERVAAQAAELVALDRFVEAVRVADVALGARTQGMAK